MIRQANTALVAVCALLSVAVCASGCKIESRKEREEQQAARASERDDEKEKKALADEEARVATAKKDLNDRIATYQAISGTYVGYYDVPAEKTRLLIKVTLTVNNLPTAVVPNRPLKESDILAQTDALSLDGLVEEFGKDTSSPATPGARRVTNAAPNAATMTRALSCSNTSIKPNLSSGTIRFNCTTGGVSNLSREYTISLDSLDANFETALDNVTIEQRSKRMADDLVTKKSTAVNAMSLKIAVPNSDLYGKLWRKNDNSSQVR